MRAFDEDELWRDGVVGHVDRSADICFDDSGRDMAAGSGVMRFILNYLIVRHDWVLMVFVASLLFGIEVWRSGEGVMPNAESSDSRHETGPHRDGVGAVGPSPMRADIKDGLNVNVTSLNSNGDQTIAHSTPVVIASDPSSIRIANNGDRMLYVTIADGVHSSNAMTFAAPPGSMTEFVPSVPLFGIDGNAR